MEKYNPSSDIYRDYARRIWRNYPDVSEDRVRWHSSGYHIAKASLGIEDALEDALEALDIDPQFCGIPVAIDDWQSRYMEDPKMVSAMASLMYDRLKDFGRYSFEEAPDWESSALEMLAGYQD